MFDQKKKKIISNKTFICTKKKKKKKTETKSKKLLANKEKPNASVRQKQGREMGNKREEMREEGKEK